LNVIVVLLKFPPDFTGAGVCIDRLYRKLKRKGLRRIYVITTAENCRPGIERREGIIVIRVALNRYVQFQKGTIKKFKKTFFVLKAIVRSLCVFRRLSREADLVHAIDSSWLSTAIGWAAFFFKKPLVKEIVLLDDDDPMALKNGKPFFLRYFFLHSFHYAKLIITLSPPLMRSCIEYGLPDSKIWCRPSPMYFDNEHGSIDSLNIDSKLPTILWVGKLGPRKNVEFLLNASFHLKGKAQLLFVGPFEDENYFNSLKDIAAAAEKQKGTELKIHFLGRIDNRSQLRQLYERSNLFWFSSHKEGLGNVVVESLLAGTPVVALPIDGIMKYMITDNADGEIMETQDPRQFAEVVNRCLYENSYDRSAIAERAKKRFDAAKIEDQAMEHFRRITGHIST